MDVMRYIHTVLTVHVSVSLDKLASVRQLHGEAEAISQSLLTNPIPLSNYFISSSCLLTSFLNSPPHCMC